MRRRFRVCVVAAVLSLFTMNGAEAAIIFDADYTWTDLEPTVNGRPLVPGTGGTTWADFPDTFVGVYGETLPYLYTTFNVQVGDATYLRVTASTVSEGPAPGTYGILVAGYQDSFSPADLSLNWLGDPGFASGNPPQTRSFEVIAAPNSTFVVLLFQYTTGTGFAGDVSHVRVEAFMDANETEPPPANVPEPGALALLGMGLAAGVRRFRRV